MATIKEYLDYAELAQASYGFLNLGTPSIQELNNQDRAKFTELQAEKFSERYTVLAVSASNASGFSATLFEDKSGKKILSIRGTEPTDGSDYYADWELTLSKHPEQYASLVSFFEDLKSSGKISTADNLVVTGHSLGGALTQMITATYPEYVDEAYTYNSPGAKNLSIPELEIKDGKYYTREFFTLDEAGNIVYSYTEITKTLYDAYLSFDANKNSVGGKVINVEAKDGPSAITDLGVDIGGNMEVFINADGDYIYNHSSKTLTQTLAFYNTLISVDSALSIAEITQFLEEVDGRNIIVKDQLGLHQELLSRMADILGADKASNVFDIGKNIVDKGVKYSIDFLTNKSTSELQSKDPANLYALLNLNPFTIEGNLPAYDSINPDDYSDMYMSDRADYMYYILDKDARYGDGVGKDSYKAWDTNRVALNGTSGNQVIFGTNNYNNEFQMNGGTGNDRIYGLAGNDTLVGNTGNDYLEGGKGFDTLMGGIGVDTYIADNGDTIYDEDKQGTVKFEGTTLSSGILREGTTDIYEGDGGIYTFDGKDLIFTKDSKSVRIVNFDKNSKTLGITLDDEPKTPQADIVVTVTDSYLSESGNEMIFTLSLNTKLNEEISHMESYTDSNGDTTTTKVVDLSAETLKVTLSTQDNTAKAGVDYESVNDAVLTFHAGEPLVKTFSVTITDDFIKEKNHTFELIPEIYSYTPSVQYPNGTSIPRTTDVNAPATGTILDDDSVPVIIDVVGFSADEGSEKNEICFINSMNFIKREVA